MAYMNKAMRFMREFGAGITEAATQDRKHSVLVHIGADVEDIVRLYIELDGFEYWSHSEIYDPDMYGWSEYALGELCGDLGLEATPENMDAVKARLIKAELWEM